MTQTRHGRQFGPAVKYELQSSVGSPGNFVGRFAPAVSLRANREPGTGNRQAGHLYTQMQKRGCKKTQKFQSLGQ